MGNKTAITETLAAEVKRLHSRGVRNDVIKDMLGLSLSSLVRLKKANYDVNRMRRGSGYNHRTVADPKGRPVTSGMIGQIATWRLQGLSVSWIATRLDLPEDTVRMIMDSGYSIDRFEEKMNQAAAAPPQTIHRKGGRGRIVNKEFARKARALAHMGYDRPTIARKLGCSLSLIDKLAHAHWDSDRYLARLRKNATSTAPIPESPRPRRHSRKFLTPEFVAEIRDAYQNSHTREAKRAGVIARKFKLHYNTVAQLRRFNWDYEAYRSYQSHHSAKNQITQPKHLPNAEVEREFWLEAPALRINESEANVKPERTQPREIIAITSTWTLFRGTVTRGVDNEGRLWEWHTTLHDWYLL